MANTPKPPAGAEIKTYYTGENETPQTAHKRIWLGNGYFHAKEANIPNHPSLIEITVDGLEPNDISYIQILRGSNTIKFGSDDPTKKASEVTNPTLLKEVEKIWDAARNPKDGTKPVMTDKSAKALACVVYKVAEEAGQPILHKPKVTMCEPQQTR